MKATLEELCDIIRKYEVDFKRKSEMSAKEREIIDWACDKAEEKLVYLNRNSMCEGELIE